VTDAVTESGTFRRREEVLRVAARLFFVPSPRQRLLLEHQGGSALRARATPLRQRGFDPKIRQDPHDALTRLRWLIEKHVMEFAENVIPSALALNESRSLSPERRQAMAAEEAAYQDGVASLIAAGQSDGTIRDDVNPRLVTMAILGAINWMYRWYNEGRGGSPRAVARQIATVLTSGLAATPPITDSLLDRLEAQARRISELEARLAGD
jgi:hypothetical protein